MPRVDEYLTVKQAAAYLGVSQVRFDHPAAADAGLVQVRSAEHGMREVHGLSYNEIAANVDMPLGTVKAALHRARERLRRELIGAGVRP